MNKFTLKVGDVVFHRTNNVRYRSPEDEDLPKHWERITIADVTSRSYVLRNGLKVPINQIFNEDSVYSTYRDGLTHDVAPTMNGVKIYSRLDNSYVIGEVVAKCGNIDVLNEVVDVLVRHGYTVDER